MGISKLAALKSSRPILIFYKPVDKLFCGDTFGINDELHLAFGTFLRPYGNTKTSITIQAIPASFVDHPAARGEVITFMSSYRGWFQGFAADSCAYQLLEVLKLCTTEDSLSA